MASANYMTIQQIAQIKAELAKQLRKPLMEEKI